MKINLKGKEGLIIYLAGIVTAMGVSALLQNHSRRVKLSVGGEEKEKTEKEKRIEVNKKLKEKEQHLVEGREEQIKKIKKIIGERLKVSIKPAKPRPVEEFISKAKVAKALKDAVVDYITDEMEDKLEDMGISGERLKRIVNLVHGKTEQILLSLDLEDLVKDGKPLEEQIVRALKTIRPILLEELKKRQKE